MDDTNAPSQSPLKLILTAVFLIIVPLALGLYLAPRVVAQPKGGIVRLSTDIFGGATFAITEQLAYARENEDVDAVVLIINSPGGSAAYSEELFLDVLLTREQLPVIASIDLLAASGAYYMAVGADEIYAKPTSGIGSIGVISSVPGEVFIEEEVLTTGPYKSFGGTRDGFIRGAERAKFAFLQAVLVGREGRLSAEATPDFLSRAEIFRGVRAKELGLIDDFLSTDEAIARAAELAGVAGYEVVELFPLAFPEDGGVLAGQYQPPVINVEQLYQLPADLPPGLYFRYFETPNQ